MIKEQIIKYRDEHREARVLCSSVLGEFDRISKNPTDEECVKIIKKLIESNKECGLLEENEILSQFLPKQLSALQVEAIIVSNMFKDLGTCMKYFKEKHSGQYDGKLVSNIYKRF